MSVGNKNSPLLWRAPPKFLSNYLLIQYLYGMVFVRKSPGLKNRRVGWMRDCEWIFFFFLLKFFLEWLGGGGINSKRFSVQRTYRLWALWLKPGEKGMGGSARVFNVLFWTGSLDLLGRFGIREPYLLPLFSSSSFFLLFFMKFLFSLLLPYSL